MSTINYIVNVASAKFTIDDAVAPKLTFRDGDTYVFDQADSSNAGHILQFSATSNNSGSSEYTTGVTKTGTAGQAGAKTTIITSGSTTDTLYYYSSGGGTYGEEFSNSGYNTSTDDLLKPIVGASSTAEKWGPMINHNIDQIVPKSGGTYTGAVRLGNLTTTERDALTPVVGMIIYNTTIGTLQQYNSQGWASIDSPPSITSFTYPGSATALDPAGEISLASSSTTNTDATVTVSSTTNLTPGMTVSGTGIPSNTTIIEVTNSTTLELSANATATGTVTLTFNSQTVVITGTNFQVGATVTIDNTAPTTVTRDSGTQITITGTPAKSAATYTNGLKVTNPTGLSALADIVYDALPAWTTAAGSLGTFVDGSYTNSSSPTIRIVAAEGSDTIDYAQTNSAGVVNTDGVAGLVLGTTGANAGYLTGTLSGTEGTTYNFYAKPTDDEGQVDAVRLFNIISGHPATGGNISTYGSYVVHTFLLSDTGDYFTPASSLAVEYVLIGGGGGGGDQGSAGSGGGGAGGFAWSNSTFSANDYTITVGAGGAGGNGSPDVGDTGGQSKIIGPSFSFIVSGGGYGGSNAVGGDGGSGGGGGHAGAGGSGDYLNHTPDEGQDGGAGGGGTSGEAGGGGGGAYPGSAGIGQAGVSGSGGYGGDGGSGWYGALNMSAADTTSLYESAGVGVDVSGTRYVGGGGGGGIGGTWGPKGDGGVGGGGNGAGNEGTAATNGVDNTGSGGGANGGTDPGPAGDGGNGFVIIRYAA